MISPIQLQRVAAPLLHRVGARFGIKDVALIMLGLEAVDMAWHWAKQYRYKDRFDRLEKRVVSLEQRIDMFSRNGDAQALKAPEPPAAEMKTQNPPQTLERLSKLIEQVADKLNTTNKAA